MEYAGEAYAEAIKTMQLSEDVGLDGLHNALDRFWDCLMLNIAPRTEDSRTRNAYHILVRQAKAQSRALDWVDEPEVFQSYTPGGAEKPVHPWFGYAAFAVLAALAVWFFLPYPMKNTAVAAACAAGALLLAVQYVVTLRAAAAARAKGPRLVTRAEQRISPKRVRSGLHQAVRELDANAETLCELLRESGAGAGDVDISLPKELLRLPESMRGEAVTEAVKLHLASKGVEMVEYSEENAGLFMLLPSNRSATVEPALVKDGRVLSEGVACVKAEV